MNKPTHAECVSGELEDRVAHLYDTLKAFGRGEDVTPLLALESLVEILAHCELSPQDIPFYSALFAEIKAAAFISVDSENREFYDFYVRSLHLIPASITGEVEEINSHSIRVHVMKSLSNASLAEIREVLLKAHAENNVALIQGVSLYYLERVARNNAGVTIIDGAPLNKEIAALMGFITMSVEKFEGENVQSIDPAHADNLYRELVQALTPKFLNEQTLKIAEPPEDSPELSSYSDGCSEPEVDSLEQSPFPSRAATPPPVIKEVPSITLPAHYSNLNRAHIAACTGLQLQQYIDQAAEDSGAGWHLISLYRALIRLEPTNKGYRYKLALALEQENAPKAALQEYCELAAQCTAREAKEPRGREVTIAIRRLQRLLDEGEGEASVASADTPSLGESFNISGDALNSALNSTNIGHLIFLSRRFQLQEDWERALLCQSRLCELIQEDPQSLHFYALILTKLERWRDAYEVRIKIRQFYNDHPPPRKEYLVNNNNQIAVLGRKLLQEEAQRKAS